MKMFVPPVLLLLGVIRVSAIGEILDCTDRSHFHYKCSQLAKYCHMPQAKRIRSSCPVTCGMCAKDSLSVQPATIADISFGQSLDSPAATLRKNVHFDDADAEQMRSLPGGGRHISPEERYRLLSARRDPFGRLKKYTTRKTLQTTAVSTLQTTIPIATTTAETATPVPQRDPLAFGSSFPIDDLLSWTNQFPKPQRDLEADLKQCCSISSMSFKCRSLCSYGVSAAEIFEKIVSATCSLEDASIWIRCASGGKNNTDCCKKSNVIDCDNLCSGKFNITEMMTCTHKHIRPILKCHEESLQSSVV